MDGKNSWTLCDLNLSLHPLQNSVSSQQVSDALWNRLSFICPESLDGGSTDLERIGCGVGNNRAVFQAQIFADVDVLHCLEYLYTSDFPLLKVSDQVLLVDHTCSQLYIDSLADPYDASCNQNIEIVDSPTQAYSTLSTVAGSLIGGIVVSVLLSVVLVIIVVLLVFRRRFLQVNTKKGGIGNAMVTVERAATRYKRKNPNSDSSQSRTQAPVDLNSVHSLEESDLGNQEVEEDGSYETVPYYTVEEGDDTAATNSKTIDSVPVSKQRTQSIDCDYEVPGNIIPEGEGALSAAAVQKHSIIVSDAPQKVEKEYTMSANKLFTAASQKSLLRVLSGDNVAPSGVTSGTGEEKAPTTAQKPPLDHRVSSSVSAKTEASISDPSTCKKENIQKKK